MDRGSVRFGGSADLHLDLHLLSDGWQEAAGLGRWPGERRLPGLQLELPLLPWQSLKLRLWFLRTVNDQRMLPVSLSSTEIGLKCVNISQSYSEKIYMSFKSDYFMIIFKGGGVRLLLLLFNYFIKPCVTFNIRNKAFFMLLLYAAYMLYCFFSDWLLKSQFFFREPSIAEFLMKKKKQAEFTLCNPQIRSQIQF